MYINCWQCGEQIDALSAEIKVYESMISYLRSLMCEGSKNDDCDLWWRHDDCRVISVIIQELKSKIVS